MGFVNSPVLLRPGEHDALLRLVKPLRGSIRYPPLIDAAGRPSPILGHAGRIVIVDLIDLTGVFDYNVVGANEVGEHVGARSVPADPPFDGIASIAHTPSAPHYRVKVRHLISNMVKRRACGTGESDAMVIPIATDEIHDPGPVAEPEPKNVGVIPSSFLDFGGVEHGMG